MLRKEKKNKGRGGSQFFLIITSTRGNPGHKARELDFDSIAKIRELNGKCLEYDYSSNLERDLNKMKQRSMTKTSPRRGRSEAKRLLMGITQN